MKLRKYELSGPATFSAEEVVWITIQETKDTDSLISEFLTWSIKEEIYSVIGAGTIGGGVFSQGFSPDDAKRAVEWLEEHGVNAKARYGG